MSEKKAVIDATKIHLSTVKVFRSTLEVSEAFLEHPKEVVTYDLGLDYDLGIDLENNNVRLRLYIGLEGKEANESLCGIEARYGIEFHFTVDNFDEFVEQHQEETRIDALFGSTLVGIAYSTARGIVMERTQSTFFDEVLLPVVNPYQVLTSKQTIAEDESIETK